MANCLSSASTSTSAKPSASTWFATEAIVLDVENTPGKHLNSSGLGRLLTVPTLSVPDSLCVSGAGARSSADSAFRRDGSSDDGMDGAAITTARCATCLRTATAFSALTSGTRSKSRAFGKCWERHGCEHTSAGHRHDSARVPGPCDRARTKRRCAGL